MQHTLFKYLPEHAVEPIFELIKTYEVYLKIVNERSTRYGDYRRGNDGRHQITINATLNPYSFLITLVHEIAHLVAFKKYGRSIKPHGIEWKYTFQQLMLPFIRPEIFPSKLLPVIANHFRNPTASSDTDAVLSVALKQYNGGRSKQYIFELPYGTRFVAGKGRVFVKGERIVKRYQCTEEASGKMFLFSPNAEVERIS